MSLSRLEDAESRGWRFGKSGPRYGGNAFARLGDTVLHGTWDELLDLIEEHEADIPTAPARFGIEDAEAAGWIVKRQTNGQVWVGLKPIPRRPEHTDYHPEQSVEHTVHGRTDLEVLQQIADLEKGRQK